MSEHVLHEWTTNSGRRFMLFDDGSIRLDKENGRMFLSGWEPAFVSELVRLGAENLLLWSALRAADDFREAVVSIERSPAMMGVYSIAAAHGFQYSGETWEAELAAYDAARAKVDK